MKQINTNYYLQHSSKYRFHLLTSIELSSVWVSTKSRWNDTTWKLDPNRKLAGNSPLINWKIKIDGGDLCDPEHNILLDSFKRLTWSLLVDRIGSTTIKATTLPRIQNGMKRLVPWLIENYVSSFDQITPELAEEFFEYLPDSISNESDDGEVTSGKTVPPIWLLSLIWKQARILNEAICVPDRDPLNGLTPESIGQHLATIADGTIPPVPDPVALPILSEAFNWFESPSESFISFFHNYIDFLEDVLPELETDYSQERAIHDFVESNKHLLPTFYYEKIFPNQPLQSARSENGLTYFSDCLRSAIRDFTASRLILIQSLTGIRSSELAELSGGPDTDNLPCIEISKSKSSLFNIFYIRTTLIKTLDAPEILKWVAGCAIAGSNNIPSIIQAIRDINLLFSPYRNRSAYSSLFFAFDTSRGIPISKDSISTPTLGYISRLQKDFIFRNVDLSFLPPQSICGEDLSVYRDSQGLIIRPHQWRNNFAQWLFRFDSRLIPAISEQFKHLSIAMTEQGYLGNDLKLLEEIDSVRERETVNFFYEASTGKRIITGGMAKEIYSQLNKLAKLSKSKLTKKSIEQWIKTKDIRIYFAEHGKCFIHSKPTDSRCNKLSKSNNWLNSKPNFETRCPDTCSGCDCFSTDNSHANFWENRYLENQEPWLQAKGTDLEEKFIIARSRATQAKQVLTAMKLPIPEIII